MAEIMQADLLEWRSKLEQVWGADTILPGEICQDHESLSKGQCAVTSYYLAQEFLQQGHDILFCKGDVVFDKTHSAIINHRWLKWGHQIIDLTADQTGCPLSVIFDDKVSLEKQGIHYQTQWEKPLAEIENKTDLFARVDRLRHKIDKLDA
jgi:hypothetical protein